MSTFVWVVSDGLAVLLFCFIVYVSDMGGNRRLGGARVERCPRCGRHGLAVRGRLHARGCPRLSYHQRLRHLCEVWLGAVHLGPGHR